MAPARSVFAKVILPKGASRKISRDAGLPFRPKKNPGCGLRYACPQRFNIIPAMSFFASKPEDPNICENWSRTGVSYSRKDVLNISLRPRTPWLSVDIPGYE